MEKYTAPTLISGVTTGYYYVDIDYNSVDTGEGYIEEQDKISVYFTVSQAVNDVRLDAVYEGTSLSGGSGVHFYSAADLTTEITTAQTVPVGNYIAIIPASVLKSHSSREIIIMATDLSDNLGRSSITFIRRSLFPLD